MVALTAAKKSYRDLDARVPNTKSGDNHDQDNDNDSLDLGQPDCVSVDGEENKQCIDENEVVPIVAIESNDYQDHANDIEHLEYLNNSNCKQSNATAAKESYPDFDTSVFNNDLGEYHEHDYDNAGADVEEDKCVQKDKRTNVEHEVIPIAAIDSDDHQKDRDDIGPVVNFGIQHCIP